MTPYSNVYKRFYRKVTDYRLGEFTDEDREEVMNGYLDSAISLFTKCEKDLSNRDDEKQVFHEDLTDIEQEILAKSLVVEWIEPQINSIMNLQPILNDHDFKTYSQANFLKVKLELKNDLQNEICDLMINYTYDVGDIENSLG